MNSLYTKGKEALLNGSIIWTTSNMKAMLIDTSLYTANLTTDQYLSDIAAGARVASSPLLATRTATGGVADAADPTISSVTSTGDVSAFVIYNDTGSASNSQLLGYFDTATGLPFTPNGGDVVLNFNASGLFSL